MRFSAAFVSFLFLMIMLACGNNQQIIYSQFIEFKNSELNKNENYIFNTAVKDSISLKKNGNKSLLMVRYSDSCNVSELPLKIEYSTSEGTICSEDLIISLFQRNNYDSDRDGFGVYETEISLPFSPDHNEGGFVAISSHEKIKGVLAIGLMTIATDN